MIRPILHAGDVIRGGEEQAHRAEQLAGGLSALGLEEGGVVAVLMRNAAPFTDIIRACRRIGVYYCPINWHFTADEASVLLRDSGAQLLIGHGDLVDGVADIVPDDMPILSIGASRRRPGALPYEAWLAAQPRYDGPLVSPRAHLGYTSGTTGKPKGVMRKPIPVEDLPAARARVRQVMEQTCGLREGCRVLLSAPLYHSAPNVFMQNALDCAEAIVLAERFDAAGLLDTIARHRIDTVYLVPIMYVRLLALPAEVRARADVSSLRFVASTGAPCAPDIKAAMIAWFGPIIHETYASTETGMVTVIGSAEAQARPGSAGRPVGDARVRIYTPVGTPCEAGEVGLIYCRQPAWPDFTYRGDDASRRAMERDGLVTLGDVGYLDADGYLYVCDRLSDMVISGGVNIYPAEVEHRLVAHPDVADCAVFGVPDAEFGERVHGVVECEPGVTVGAADLIHWMRQSLASYKVPRTIDFAPLPRDDNGKIAKRKLRAAHWADQSRRV